MSLSDEQMMRLEALTGQDTLTDADMAELEALQGQSVELGPVVAQRQVDVPQVEGFSTEDLSAEVKANEEWRRKNAKYERISAARKAALGTNADDAAATVEVARRLGLPFSEVRKNLKAFRESADVADFDPRRWEKDNPALAKVLINNPELSDVVMTSKELGPVAWLLTKATDWAEDAWQAGIEAEQATGTSGVRRAFLKLASGEAFGMGLPGVSQTIEKEVAGLSPKELEDRERDRAASYAPKLVAERPMTPEEKAEVEGFVGNSYMRQMAAVAWIRARESARQLAMTKIGFRLMVAENGGDGGGDVADIRAELYDAQRASTPMGGLGDNSGYLRDIATTVSAAGSQVEVLKGSLEGAGAAGAAGAVLGGAAGAALTKTPQGAVAGASQGARLFAGTGAKVGAAWSAFNMEAGSTYLELDEAETEGKERLTAQEKMGTAVLAGAAKAGLEFVSFSQVTKLATGSYREAIANLVKRDPTFRKLLGEVAVEWLKSTGVEGVTEGAQTAIDQAAKYLALSLKDGAWQSGPVFNPEQIIADTEAGAMAGGVSGAVSSAMTLGFSKTISDKTAVEDRQIGPLMKMAALPEVKAAPGAFAQMVEQVSAENGGKPLKEVHVDAAAISKFYQDAGVDPEAQTKELTELLGPEGPQKVAEAVAQGGKVAVSIEQVLGKYGESKLGQALIEDTTTDRDGLTPRQRKEQQAQLDSRTEAIVQEELERLADEQHLDNLITEYAQSIVEAGITDPKVVSKAAAEFRSRLTIAATDMQKSVRELYPTLPMKFAPGDEQRTPNTPVPVADIQAPATAQVEAEARVLEPSLESLEAQMTDEQRGQMLFVDDVAPGLLTRRGFDETAPTPNTVVGVITIPDVKGINDDVRGGHDVTNRLLASLGAKLAPLTGGRRAARSGTDFLVDVAGQTELDAIVAQLQQSAPEGVRVLGFTGADTKTAYENEKKGTGALRALPETDARRVLPRGETAFKRETLTDDSFPSDAVQPRKAPEGARLRRGKEFVDEVLRDRRIPGALSRMGFKLSPARSHSISIDMRGLKRINELAEELVARGLQVDKDALGDAVMAAFGKAAMDLGGAALFFAHLSGDEFAAKANDPKHLEDFAAALEAELQNIEVPVTLSDGSQAVLSPRFRFGIAEGSYGRADQALNRSKSLEGKQPAGTPASDLRRAGILGAPGDVGGRTASAQGVTAGAGTQAGVAAPGTLAPAEGADRDGRGSAETDGRVPLGVDDTSFEFGANVEEPSEAAARKLIAERAKHHELRQEEEVAITQGFNSPAALQRGREAIARFRAPNVKEEKPESPERKARRQKAAINRRDARKAAATAFLDFIEGTGPGIHEKGSPLARREGALVVEPELFKETRTWARKLGLIDPSNGVSEYAAIAAGLGASTTGQGKTAKQQAAKKNVVRQGTAEAERNRDLATEFRRNVLGRFDQDSTRLMSGREELAVENANTRNVALALEQRQREALGTPIALNDRTQESAERIAKWMAAEVEFELDPKRRSQSGAGWYGEKWQKALDQFARRFPELKSDKTARNLFTLLVAVTSNGEKVTTNFKNATTLYAARGADGMFPVDALKGQRSDALVKSIETINSLLEQYGPDEIHKRLLAKRTVGELRELAQKEGLKFEPQYEDTEVLPMSAVLLGPKLGAFYANLMGDEGYLTMDRWWSRTFNRYRGNLVSEPTQTSLDNLRLLLGQPDLSHDQLLWEAATLAGAYEARGFRPDIDPSLTRLLPMMKKGDITAHPRPKLNLAKVAALLAKDAEDIRSPGNYGLVVKAWKGVKSNEKRRKYDPEGKFPDNRPPPAFFERMRSSMVDKDAAVKRAKKMLGKQYLAESGGADPEVVARELGYKSAIEMIKRAELERLANTVAKAAFKDLEDTPQDKSDRTFMRKTVEEAQKRLGKKGIRVTTADVQAILWYYEKRLYAELGANASPVVSYEDAARVFVETGKQVEEDADEDVEGSEPVGADGEGAPRGRRQVRRGGDEGRLNQDDSETPTPPRWYSQVSRAVAAAKQAKNTAQAWWSVVSKSPGVKAEELELIGLKAWLDEQKGSIPREAVQKFVDENRVDVVEVIGAGDLTLEQRLRREQFEKRIDADLGVLDREISALKKAAAAKPGPNGQLDFKLSRAAGDLLGIHDKLNNILDYSLGRDSDSFAFLQSERSEAFELLVEARENSGQKWPAELLELEQALDPKNATVTELFRHLVMDSQLPMYDRMNITEEENPQGYREVLFYHPTAEEYESSHFGLYGEGLLAHARVTDRKLNSGEDILFVEEVQSDLHQSGRDVGYKRPTPDSIDVDSIRLMKEPTHAKTGRYLLETKTMDPETRTIVLVTTQIRNEGEVVESVGEEVAASLLEDARNHKTGIPLESMEPGDRKIVGGPALRDIMARLNMGHPPKAAFSKNWEELVAKRMITLAIEDGRSTVGWVRGIQPAAAFGFATPVKELELTDSYDHDGDEILGALFFTTRDGEDGQLSVPNTEMLELLVGKEAAARLIEQRGNRISGPDLFVSQDGNAQGMLDAYDARLPSIFRKLVKEHGGEVKKQELSTGEEVWTVTLPEKFREQVKAEGMRLFQEQKDDDTRTPNEQLKARIEEPLREFLLTEGIRKKGIDQATVNEWLADETTVLVGRQSDGKWVALRSDGSVDEEQRFDSQEEAEAYARRWYGAPTAGGFDYARRNFGTDNLAVPDKVRGALEYRERRLYPERVYFRTNSRGVPVVSLFSGDGIPSTSVEVTLDEVVQQLPAVPAGLTRDLVEYRALVQDELRFEREWAAYNEDVGYVLGGDFEVGEQLIRPDGAVVTVEQVDAYDDTGDGQDDGQIVRFSDGTEERFAMEEEADYRRPSTLPAPKPVAQRKLGKRWFQNDDESKTPGKVGAKGYAIIEPTRAAGDFIRLFLNKTADVSTILHEGVHGWLEHALDLAERPDATPRIKKKAQDILDALGVKSRKEIDKALHEKVARAYERWAFEGDKPTKKMARLFRDITSWMMQIYRSIVAVPGVDPVVLERMRPVFEAWHATEQQLKAARRRQGPKNKNLTEEQQQQEDDEYAEATYDAQLAATKDALREHTRWWNAGMAKARKQFEDEYARLPTTRALEILKGEPGVGSIELDRDAVLKVFGTKKTKDGRTVPARVVPGVRLVEGGVEPGFVAELSGFKSGDEMLKALLDMPSREKWVEQMAQQQMEAQHPHVYKDIAKFRKMVEGGLKAVTEERLRREWAGLPREAIKAAAKRLAGEHKVGAVKAHKALAQMRAAARDKAEAAAAGDIEAAGVAARSELLNFYLHGALVEAEEQVEKFLDLAKALGKSSAQQRLGKASPLYRDAVEFIRGVVLDKPNPTLSADALKPAIDQLNGDAVIIGDPDWLGPLMAGLGQLAPGMDYNDLKVKELGAFHDALKMFQAGARQRTSMLIEDREVDFDQVKAEVLKEVATHLPKRKPVVEKHAQTMTEKMRSGLSALDGLLTSPVDMVRELVGGDTSSTLFKVVVNTLRRAQMVETDLLEQRIKPIIEAFEKMPGKMRDALQVPVDGRALFPGHVSTLEPPRRRYELLMLALNVGSESSLNVVTEGRGITSDQIQQALADLTEDEIAWVNTVHKSLEALREPAFALEERETGIRPEAIVARPMSLKNGTLTGGYFPLKASPDVSNVGARMFGDDTLASLVDPAFTRPTTRHGHLKQRTGATYPVTLDPDVTRKHLLQVTHDIAFREAVKSVGKLVMDPDVRQALVDRLGPERARTWHAWLKDVGGANAYQSNIGEDILRSLKSNMASAVLSGLSTAFGNLANLPTAWVGTNIKAKHLAAGTMQAATVEGYELAHQKSGVIRTMRSKFVDQLQKNMASVYKGKVGRGLEWTREAGGAAMRAIDAVTNTATWLGAYRQGLAEIPLDPNETREEAERLRDQAAVRFADDQLLMIAPSRSLVEKSGILRDRGWLGGLSLFYGYLNQMYRAQRRIASPLLTQQFQAIGKGEKALEAAKVGGQLLGLYIAFGVLGEALMGRGPEAGDADDDDPENKEKKWARWFTRKLVAAPLSTVPIVPIASTFEGAILGKKVNTRADPATTALLQLNRAGQALGKAIDSEDDDDARKASVEALRATGLLLGQPTTLIEKSGGFLWDITGGDVVVAPWEVPSGVLYGTPKDAEREVAQ